MNSYNSQLCVGYIYETELNYRGRLFDLEPGVAAIVVGEATCAMITRLSSDFVNMQKRVGTEYNGWECVCVYPSKYLFIEMLTYKVEIDLLSELYPKWHHLIYHDVGNTEFVTIHESYRIPSQTGFLDVKKIDSYFMMIPPMFLSMDHIVNSMSSRSVRFMIDCLSSLDIVTYCGGLKEGDVVLFCYERKFLESIVRSRLILNSKIMGITHVEYNIMSADYLKRLALKYSYNQYEMEKIESIISATTHNNKTYTLPDNFDCSLKIKHDQLLYFLSEPIRVFLSLDLESQKKLLTPEEPNSDNYLMTDINNYISLIYEKMISSVDVFNEYYPNYQFHRDPSSLNYRYASNFTVEGLMDDMYCAAYPPSISDDECVINNLDYSDLFAIDIDLLSDSQRKEVMPAGNGSWEIIYACHQGDCGFVRTKRSSG